MWSDSSEIGVEPTSPALILRLETNRNDARPRRDKSAPIARSVANLKIPFRTQHYANRLLGDGACVSFFDLNPPFRGFL